MSKKGEFAVFFALTLALPALLGTSFAGEWSSPVLVGEPPTGTNLYVEGMARSGHGTVLLACTVLFPDSGLKAALVRVDLRGASGQVFVPDTLPKCKHVQLARVGTSWYLVWNRPAGPLPDGLDRYQLIMGKVTTGGIEDVHVVADSVDINLAAGSAGGVAFVATKQTYRGIQYRKAGLLFRLSRTGQKRLKLPQGEWHNPFVTCQDSNTVHIVGWSGFAVQYAVSYDGGTHWAEPAVPVGASSMQHPGVAFWNDRTPVLFWERDVNGDVWPDKLFASWADASWRWSDATCVSCPWWGQQVGSRRLSFCSVRVKGRWPLLYVAWTEGQSAWAENQDTYFSYFDGRTWAPKIRVLSGTQWLGNPQILVDVQGVVHIFGTDYTDGGHIGIYYTRSTSPITGVGSEPAEMPSGFELTVYPSPFNESTRVRYTLPRAGDVRLQVLDVRGVPVRDLVRRQQAAGEHAVRWDGRDDAGQPLPSGVYLLRLQAGTQTATRKVVLVR